MRSKQWSFSTAASEPKQRRACSGHTLAEVLIGMGVLGFMIVTLYAGFSAGFAWLRVARENLRATQILEERMEVIRLVKWDDAKLGFIPETFTAPFYANDSEESGGLLYNGKVTIEQPPIEESYARHLRMIQIDLTWTSGKVLRTRQMTTYVSEYGIQKYVYN